MSFRDLPVHELTVETFAEIPLQYVRDHWNPDWPEVGDPVAIEHWSTGKVGTEQYIDESLTTRLYEFSMRTRPVPKYTIRSQDLELAEDRDAFDVALRLAVKMSYKTKKEGVDAFLQVVGNTTLADLRVSGGLVRNSGLSLSIGQLANLHEHASVSYS